MRLKFDGSLEHEKDMDCMNILVTGSSGQLGRALKELACGSRHRFVFTSPDACEDGLRVDITDRSSVMRAVSAGVDVIINCAAYTDVEAAQDNPREAMDVNAGAAGILADAAREAGAVLMHISTDYVFDGKANTPYREDAEASAVNVYGMTKLEGERYNIKLYEQSPVPQLWIAGQRDARFSALARRMAGGQAVIIPHAGHRLPLETPERLAECLQPFILQNL